MNADVANMSPSRHDREMTSGLGNLRFSKVKKEVGEQSLMGDRDSPVRTIYTIWHRGLQGEKL